MLNKHRLPENRNRIYINSTKYSYIHLPISGGILFHLLKKFMKFYESR